jgi:hypothetical protein
MFYAVAAEPALIRVKDNGGLLFFRIGDKNISATDIDACKAGCTEFRINNNILAWGERIWD